MSPSVAARLRDLARRAAVVGTSAAAVLVSSLPDPHRAVLLLAGITLAVSVAAAVIRWRLLGTLTLVFATLTALLAGALDASTVRPAQVVAVASLLLVLLAVLAGNEDGRYGGRGTVVARGPLSRRVAAPAAALLAGCAVAVTAAQDVVPSVPLVLVGLTAAVAALVVAVGSLRR